MSMYLDVLDAVAAYYGAGSDQWVEIAKYGIHADNLESIISQVPYANIIKANDGTIRGFTFDQTMSVSDGGIAGAINSNVQEAVAANGNTFQAPIPATGGYNAQTGSVELSSGATTAGGSVVAAVLDKVHLGIAGVTIGAKLGAFIDSRIYNAAPGFWDEVAPTINPQTWNSIASTEYGKGMVNALFGVDQLTGNTQMYLPADVMAYMAYMMKDQGFFATGGKVFPQTQTTGTVAITSYDNANSMFNYGCANLPGGLIEINQNAQNMINNFMSNFGNLPASVTVNTREGSYSGYSPVKTYAYRNVGDTINLDVNNYAAVLMVNGQSSGQGYRITDAYIDYKYVRPFVGEIVEQYQTHFSGINTSTASGKEGVTPQPDTSLPDTSTWSDINTTDQALRQLFPDDYGNDSIYVDVPQPDGTVKHIQYVPVPTIATTGAGQDQPVNEDVTADDTTVTDDSPIDLINTIIRYILGEETETTDETPDLPDEPNPPDTGGGDTPAVVTPTGQASALWAIYNPSQSEIDSFGAWLWSSNFIDQVLKLFNNPMQAIIGLHKIFATPDVSGTGTIVVGYLDSQVTSNLVGSQYTDVNCGTVNVFEYFGNVFDYTETRIRLYLPFIGIVELDTADIMRSSIQIVYHVDVITGACLAEVKVTRDASGGTLYQYAGDAAVRYPISSGSYMGIVSGVLTAAGSVASAIMTGGATLPMAAGAIAGGVSSAHTNIQHSGNFSGNAGAMGAKKPYLIIERPQTCIASGYSAYQGIGENAVKTVSQMAGYFRMTDVKLNSVAGAADEELEIIRAALESGVIL